MNWPTAAVGRDGPTFLRYIANCELARLHCFKKKSWNQCESIKMETEEPKENNQG